MHALPPTLRRPTFFWPAACTLPPICSKEFACFWCVNAGQNECRNGICKDPGKSEWLETKFLPRKIGREVFRSLLLPIVRFCSSPPGREFNASCKIKSG